MGVLIYKTKIRAFCLFSVVLSILFKASTQSQVEIRWDPITSRLSVNVEQLPLTQLLERLSQITGWQIYTEPELPHYITAKFYEQPIHQGLRKLLGELNFAIFYNKSGAAVLYVFKGSLRNATTPIKKGSPPINLVGKVIENELLVLLKNPLQLDQLISIVESLGGKIIASSLEHQIFRIKFDNIAFAKEALEKLIASLDIEAFHNIEYPWPYLNPVSYDLEKHFWVKPSQSPEPVVTIALIDTPVNINNPIIKSFLLPPLNIVPPPSIPEDQITHGTAMVYAALKGIIEAGGQNSNIPVRILPINIYSQSESTTAYELAIGIESAIKANVDIINLSLGSTTDHPVIKDLIKTGSARGITFIAAAGNTNNNEPIYPAAYEQVIAATAKEPNGQLAYYANQAEYVDVAAPGFVLVPFQNICYLVEGTSPAAAYTSGWASYLIIKGGLKGELLSQSLRNLLPFRLNY